MIKTHKNMLTLVNVQWEAKIWHLYNILFCISNFYASFLYTIVEKFGVRKIKKKKEIITFFRKGCKKSIQSDIKDIYNVI